MLFVLALLVSALWWLRRKSLVRVGVRGKRKHKQAKLESVERLRLSSQHTLHLVRAADRALIVAVHASGCSLLESRPWEEFEHRNDRAPAMARAAGAVR